VEFSTKIPARFLSKNPYKVLNLPKTATLDDLAKAYRTLARKYHPDVYGSNNMLYNLL